MWRKGEKIDEARLFITCFIMIGITVIIDLIFITNGAWYYDNGALIGRIGVVPIDDILFGIFNAITIIGFYTSLPNKNTLTARW